MKVENDSWLVTVWTIRGKKIVSKKDANSRSAGNPPYRRGIHPGMYKDRLWTMRQYAGFSSPTNTNNRFKKLLDSGQTGLSIAFDLPTQLGLDSDDELSSGEVGKVGVPIDSIHDMRELFADIDMGSISTSMTINAPATTLLALYAAVAEEQGVENKNISGTVQNDILKEYISRGLYIFPPEPSIRLTTDLMSWCNDNAPRWNTISISGYHMREAGCTAPQEIALTIANAIFYARKAIEIGMQIDDFAPRMSFFFACHNNFIEEVSKFRAARQLWYELVEEEFAPKNPKSSQLRFHTQTSGVTLTAQQPLNNAIRVAYQALSAVLGGTQSLHTNSFDEALGLPTENSARLALRTQQIIAEELGITEYVDPLGGSPTIEKTTDDLILQARSIIHDIENMGGAMECVKAGLQQRIIHESAWGQLSRIENGLELVVGVNTHVDEEEPDFEGLVLDSSEANSKISHLIEMKTNRNNKSVNDSLIELRKCCRNGSNVMYPIISAVKAEATVGEVNTILREEFGTWVAPSGV
ncbi:MAG: methylmalonyl-CoA mutase [Methanobacteriota archaeon]|jgi:methylmalonyl-CoA mutase N-terminal domain/subunit|nr:MAG: methylmalonyl-CoA mutase [Euryarchaeota archaeon]HIL67134.1 methylmalonyl-CoA mutase [Candidatus Poseidoniales archaeon]